MAKSKQTSDDRRLLLQLIEESFDQPNWNATNLRSALRRVTPKMAGWRPPGGKRSIADIVAHCAYWKYALRRRLRNDPRGSFPLKGSNWFSTPSHLSSLAWKEYLVLLDDEHAKLCEAISNSQQKIAHSKRKPATDELTLVQRLIGMGIHDAYHTGQINLIKAMYRRKSNRRKTV